MIELRYSIVCKNTDNYKEVIQMKIAKRITSLLLTFVFAFTSLCVVTQAADFSDVPETSAYNEAITSLVDSGIINGYEDGTFRPDNTITRAEFSKLLAVSSAPTGYVFSATTTNFPDIADMNAAHGWAVPYISYAVSTKAINGYTDGTFQAGNPVTYGEAIKMIVCTLGYAPVVDTTLTPWYQGYINIANSIGLTKNAMSLGDSPANRGIVAQLVYNMLDCPVLTQTGVDANGNPIYSNDGGDSFADSKDNAKSAEGIVMGVTDYSLDATAVGRNRVQIDDTVYSLSNKLDMDTVKSLIGYRVNYSLSGNGSKAQVTKITKLTGSNSEITLEPWQIASIDEGYIEYFANRRDEESGKVTKISLSSDLYVIYNSMPVNPIYIDAAFISTYFDIETGSIKLFSNDGNEKNAEVAFVEKYETYFVNSPATSNGITTIYDKNSAYTGISQLALNEDDVTVSKVGSKGAKPVSATIGAISPKTVVSVAVPYGADPGQSKQGTSVIVSSAYVSGDVTELSSDYENIEINSQSYELSPYYRALMENNSFVENNENAIFTNGDNAKFYLDYLGRIAYVEKNETTDPYGLIVAYSSGGGIDSSKALKLMTAKGQYLEYTMKSPIKVDGDSKTPTEAIEYLTEKAAASDGTTIVLPVKYKTSGSTFTSIETLSPSISRTSLTYATSGYSFKAGSSTKFTMTTSGSKATVAFIVPSDITDYAKYKKVNANNFTNGTAYSVEAYEVENSSARLVVCYLGSSQELGAKIVASTPVYLVDSINDARNSAGQTVKKLKYRNIESAEEAKEILSSDNDDVISALSSIQSGDLIKFVTDNGEISDVKKVFVNGVLETETGTALIAGHHIYKDGNTTGDKQYQVVYGTIYDQNDDAKQIKIIPELYANSALDEGSQITFNQGTSVQYYEYNTSGQNANQFITSSSGAIRKYSEHKTTNPAFASKAVVVVMNGKVVGVYIMN